MPRLSSWPERLAALCFAAAGLRHFSDVVREGWLPYAWAPPPVNAFWTSLLLWDAVAALLLLLRPRLGLPFAVAVMVADVGVNGSLAVRTGLSGVLGIWTLLAQTAFLGFLAGLLAGRLSPSRQER